MPPHGPKSRSNIIAAASAAIRQRGAGGVSVELVAKQAGCAKGLVHYHFKTKRGLFEAVAGEMAAERESAWRSAFDEPAPEAIIDRTWRLLTEESATGTTRAWTSLLGAGGGLSEQTVSAQVARFCGALGQAAMAMLERMGLRPAVPAHEIGWLLGAVLDGMGLQLASGAEPAELEGAYAALWLGILSLGESRGVA